MTEKLTLAHIVRSRPPWRGPEHDITECGLKADAIAESSLISREQYEKRLKDLGKQRTAMVTCMTCRNAMDRWQTWAAEPTNALERELHGPWRKKHPRLDAELRALIRLYEEHAEEFERLIAQDEWAHRERRTR